MEEDDFDVEAEWERELALLDGTSDTSFLLPQQQPTFTSSAFALTQLEADTSGEHANCCHTGNLRFGASSLMRPAAVFL